MVEFVSWLKDWAALVVAGVALVLSVIAILQKRWYHPRPRLERDGEGWATTEGWTVPFINNGNASAHDVRATLILKDGARVFVDKSPVLAPGETFNVSAYFRTLTDQYDEQGNQKYKDIGVKVEDMRLLLTWYGYPGWFRRRITERPGKGTKTMTMKEWADSQFG